MTDVPEKKLQLLLYDKNTRAGKIRANYEKKVKDMGPDDLALKAEGLKLDESLKNLDARYYVRDKLLGGSDLSAETMLEKSKIETEKLFNERYTKDPGLVEDMTKTLRIKLANLFKSIETLDPKGYAVKTVCGIIGAKADGGTVQGCIDKINQDPIGSATKLQNSLPEVQSGPLSAIKNAANTFLNFAKRGGRFGVFLGAGAVSSGLVKTFFNDDPSTYLSNEDQQKNMLIDMITQPLDQTPEVEPSTLKYELPALGGAIAAGTAAVAPSTIKATRGKLLNAPKSGFTKTALKTFGRGIAAATTPLGLLATEPLLITNQIRQGDSLGEVATNPANYLGVAFASTAAEQASRGFGPAIAKTMRLGLSPTVLKTVSRRFGIPGLALSMGISGYEMYDNYRKGKGLFDD